MLGLDLGADESDDGEEFAPTGKKIMQKLLMKTLIKAEALEPCLAIKEGVTREGTTRRCNIGGKNTSWEKLDCELYTIETYIF